MSSQGTQGGIDKFKLIFTAFELGLGNDKIRGLIKGL